MSRSAGSDKGAPAVSSLWLIPVLLLAAGVRLLGLGNTDLWGDEAFSVAVAASLARSFSAGDDTRRATAGAVVAGVLVALNPLQVWYSQEARRYAQVSFFAGLATLALLRLWSGKRGGIPIYAAPVLGAAGSYYYGLFVPLAHGVAVLAFSRDQRAATWRWLRAIGRSGRSGRGRSDYRGAGHSRGAIGTHARVGSRLIG